MRLKTNLHFHCKEDPNDTIDYTFCEGIDRAAALGFHVIALTLHDYFGYTDERAAYARERGILLIPGIEKTVEGRHVVLLGCDKAAENIKNFDDLRVYKKKIPCVVLAPHPYFFLFSLKEKLEKNIGLFDAIEWSWYYSRRIDRNIRAWECARSHGLPYIATSDTHTLKFLDQSYATLFAKEKTIISVFEAIRAAKFENYSRPVRFFSDMIVTEFFLAGRDMLNRFLRRLPT